MTEYLSIKEVAEKTRVNRTTILYRIRQSNKGFPQPDAVIRHGRINTYGWLPGTIEEYNTNKKEN